MTSERQIPGPNAQFFDYLAQGRFMLQCEQSTQQFVFFPREMAREGNYDWVPASGDASVYSFTTVRRKAERGGDYNVAIIELAEGPRLMSRVEGIDPHQVTIGMAVNSKIITTEKGEPLLVFVPAVGGDQ